MGSSARYRKPLLMLAVAMLLLGGFVFFGRWMERSGRWGISVTKSICAQCGRFLVHQGDYFSGENSERHGRLISATPSVLEGLLREDQPCPHAPGGEVFEERIYSFWGGRYTPGIGPGFWSISFGLEESEEWRRNFNEFLASKGANDPSLRAAVRDSLEQDILSLNRLLHPLRMEFDAARNSTSEAP